MSVVLHGNQQNAALIIAAAVRSNFARSAWHSERRLAALCCKASFETKMFVIILSLRKLHDV
jgi:hypothetical protein